MRGQRFEAVVVAGPGGRGVITVPFDPDQVWGSRAAHPVGGTIDGRMVRGTITHDGGGWVFSVTPMWMRDAGVVTGVAVTIELTPEGPQRADLAEDIATALAAVPAAAAFFDTLPQFYRKAYLRWIDATVRRPELRPARIAEVVDLLAAGIKQRPRVLACPGMGNEIVIDERGAWCRFTCSGWPGGAWGTAGSCWRAGCCSPSGPSPPRR
jgi:Bacteriocin-protection, YdeI or OmpD-Associated/Domain of unknown function (DUF1905)